VNDIKIDKSFVMNMSEDANDAVIVRSTIELAHNLGLGVIAEGVETIEAWNQLAALGCDVAQGFLMCRPVPADELSAWIATTQQTSATPTSA
jgi:EAL domain-containing protein (putative c-di-GMP-specific phosphodiesterase class I)